VDPAWLNAQVYTNGEGYGGALDLEPQRRGSATGVASRLAPGLAWVRAGARAGRGRPHGLRAQTRPPANAANMAPFGNARTAFGYTAAYGHAAPFPHA